MVEQNFPNHFFEAWTTVITETFETGRDGYLDRGTSILETLATLSAEEASLPVSADCATIAAHVAHLTVAMNFSVHVFRGEPITVHWGEVWETVRGVTEEEWRASQASLRENYAAYCELAKTKRWETVEEIQSALEAIAHSAYHLGEIRHALCTVKPMR